MNVAHPQRGLGPVGWPPRDAAFGIELDDHDCSLVLSMLTESIEVTRLLLSGENDPRSHEEQRSSLESLEKARDELAEIAHTRR